jgi:hypothetical protein
LQLSGQAWTVAVPFVLKTILYLATHAVHVISMTILLGPLGP